MEAASSSRRARSSGRKKKRRREDSRSSSLALGAETDNSLWNYGLPSMEPWQSQVFKLLEDFSEKGQERRQVPDEFDCTSPQFNLLKQLAPAQNAVIVERDSHFWLRRVSAKAARAGPFGAIRHVLKQHRGRMSVKQCAFLLVNAKRAYGDQRLMLQMYGMLKNWHERMNLKQFQSEFKRVGVVFDKKMTWMAVKGKTPGPESDTESDKEEEVQAPQHVVSVGVGEKMESQLRDTLRLARQALEEEEKSQGGRADADSDKAVSSSVSGDGFPWWGEAPAEGEPVDAGKSRRARVAKRALPAYEMRDIVNDAIEEFPVVVIVGATGCGKSTQLPIAWHERVKAKNPKGPCRVICCQPRKIAAVSLGSRVALEVGTPLGGRVGYKIRFETKASRQTDLLYCTTGVLLRALMRNPTLQGVSCVFIDEVHERDVLSDFTMLVLRDVMRETRKDLKLVLMSATVDPTWCQKYFPHCHVVDLPGEQPHSVEWNWLEDCLKLTGHTPRIPEQERDVVHVDKLDALLQALPDQHRDRSGAVRDSIQASQEWIDYELIVKLVEHIERAEDPLFLRALEEETGTDKAVKGAVLIFMPGMGEIRQLIKKLRDSRYSTKWSMMPLHSTIPQAEQQKAFEWPKDDQRKIIVSTNIAESSVTIDDVVYVIDSGRERLIGLNLETNISSLMTQWIARSNACQRKGRAGRCRAGSYYALFSSVQYNSCFVECHPPEMQRTQVESLCLQAKALGFSDLRETLGRAPAPPDPRTVNSGVRTLITLGALREDGGMTRLGRLLMVLPVHPQLGKFLLYARLLECTDAALTIAAAMDVGRVFTMVPGAQREAAEISRLKLGGGFRSDHWSIVQAYRQWLQAAEQPGEQRKVADSLFVNHRSLEQVQRLRDEFVRNLQELQGSQHRPVDKAPGCRDQPEKASDEMTLVSAALAASFHLARVTPLFDLVCLNSPPCKATTASLSVNAAKHLIEPRLFQECLAVWFSRLQTSQLFVDDCSIIPAVHMLLLGPPFLKQAAFPRYLQLKRPDIGVDAAETIKQEREEMRQQKQDREREERVCVSSIRNLIAELYEEHNPSKLDELDGLFKKYEGIERDMYARICAKYGVKPDPKLLPSEAEQPQEQGGTEARSAADRGRVRHIARQVPWLQCTSTRMLDLLLELRGAMTQLLDSVVGQPLGALRPTSALAIRTFRRLLLDIGPLADLRMQEHHTYGALWPKGEQLPAPLEEPWISEVRRPHRKDPARVAATGSNERLDWKRDPHGTLASWLARELQDLQGHALELAHLNELLKRELGDAGKDPPLSELRVTRYFINSYGAMFRMVGDGSVALADQWGLQPEYFQGGWDASWVGAWADGSGKGKDQHWGVSGGGNDGWMSGNYGPGYAPMFPYKGKGNHAAIPMTPYAQQYKGKAGPYDGFALAQQPQWEEYYGTNAWQANAQHDTHGPGNGHGYDGTNVWQANAQHGTFRPGKGIDHYGTDDWQTNGQHDKRGPGKGDEYGGDNWQANAQHDTRGPGKGATRMDAFTRRTALKPQPPPCPPPPSRLLADADESS